MNSAGLAIIPLSQAELGQYHLAMTVWQNGVLLPEEEVRLSPFDSGLTVGKGVFETLIALRGEPFAWTRHYERLSRSAESLGIDLLPLKDLREGTLALLAANEFQTGRIRLTVTGGVGGPGVSRKGPPTSFITATPFIEFPREVMVCSGSTRDFSGPLDVLKSLSYLENILAMEEAKRRGFDEILIPNQEENLCEASGSNVFIVRQGEVLTPSLADGCLAGVTRALILDLLKREGIPHRESSLPFSELSQADEIWLSSSTRKLQRVTKLESQRLGPAPLFEKMRAAFDELMREQIDP